MMNRRTFFAATAAATALPQIASASDPRVFDPTPQSVRVKPEYAPGQLLILPRSYTKGAGN